MIQARAAWPGGPGSFPRGIVEPRPGGSATGQSARALRIAASRLLGAHVAAFLEDRGTAPGHARALLQECAEPDAPEAGADDLTAGPAGLDSLALLELLARLTRTFELQRTGVEDHMLIEPRLQAWAGLLQAHWDLLGDAAAIVFRTSGSTGEPRPVRHRVDALRREAGMHVASTLQSTPARIVALVPAQHIYGAIFTAFLPDYLGVEVLDLSRAAPSRLSRLGRAGDLVIGTPFSWDLVLTSLSVLPEGMHGIVSAAPAPSDLWLRAEASGLRSLTEIYGATETGGIGTRSSGAAPFDLLPGLSFAPIRAGEQVTITQEDGHRLDVQDRLEPCGPRQFRVLGRHDGAVQVGGVNVSPERTRRCIAGIDGVAEVAVRHHGGRLHAFVVPGSGSADTEALSVRIRAVLADTLPAPARPETLSIGPSLPRDGMGKIRDWLAADGVDVRFSAVRDTQAEVGADQGKPNAAAAERPARLGGDTPVAGRGKGA
jgi:4-coumarate--CoA ligase